MSQRGHEMSSEQLNVLWHLEFKWAHELMGLPLRSCSAKPEPQWGTPMDEADYNRLKDQVRRMWLRAAVLFSCFDNESGWGLQVNVNCEKNVSLTEKSFTILGWLSRAPTQEECPTGHRYLRSPIGSDLYLGGPISLANYSSSPTVRGLASTSNKPPGKNSFYMVTIKPLAVGTPITWSYNITDNDPNTTFYSVHEWQLKVCCNESDCTEGDKTAEDGSTGKLKRKRLRRCVNGQARKSQRIVKSFKLCTYCGLNLDDDVTRKNMKAHMALQHSVQICHDGGLEVDSREGVPHTKFLSHLHITSKVIASLQGHNYVVIPACHFFPNMNCEIPPSHAGNNREREEMYHKFLNEAKESFRKYHVVHLRGLTVPSCYEDLLPVELTTYKDVSWEGVTPPRSNNFATHELNLTDEETQSLELDIKVNLENIVKAYSDMAS